MKDKQPRTPSIQDHPLPALAFCLLAVYMAFTFTRLAFLAANWHLYDGSLSLTHAIELFRAGLIFDTTAILYLNAPVILLLLMPLHLKERPAFYRMVRVLFVILNMAGLGANIIDCVYFPFTGKRTTASVFQEFANEGAQGLGRIFAGQAARHWPLVVLFFALAIGMWRAFRPRPAQTRRPQRLLGYYILRTLVFLAAIPPVVIAIRGGIGKSTRPITISNANEYADRPAETGIILNTPFSIIRTLKKTPFQVPQYLDDDQAARFFNPVHQPADSLPFTPRNVVVIILESFSKQHFGFYNRTLRDDTYLGFTPFLDSLCAQGALTWRYSYANGRKSIEGMPSVLSGLPNYVEPLFLTPASLNHLSGLARELGENRGYTTAFFHGAQNSSMGFHAFARATGFQQYYGRTEYNQDPLTAGDNDFDGTWAIWDEEFLSFYSRKMSELPEPFMTAVFTASSHDPFRLPERYNGVFPEGESPLQRCVAYSDNALRLFFREAHNKTWYDNTLFVITADHTSQQIDPFYKTTLGNYCVPIILYSPSDSTLLRGYDEEKIIQQSDIMPTVLGLLHYDRPFVAFGQDVLHTPAPQTFALHWLPESSGYEYVRGNYLLQFDGRQTIAAYRFRTDSLLRDNILDIIPPDTLGMLENQMKSVIQQYMQRMTQDRLLPDR